MRLLTIRSIDFPAFPQNNAAVIRFRFGLGHSPWQFLNGTVMKAGSFELETLIRGFANRTRIHNGFSSLTHDGYQNLSLNAWP